jgi:hypothetical protein
MISIQERLEKIKANLQKSKCERFTSSVPKSKCGNCGKDYLTHSKKATI